ncbi:MAG: ATP-binding protein [Nanoarchaeota archaeon]
MIPQFIDRKREIEYLEKLHQTKEFKIAVLYGRRRVGKTELLRRFLEGKKGTYILCTDESLDENIKEFKSKFYELTGKDYFLKVETESFYDIFKYLIDEIKDKEATIIIDEFPYLIVLNKGLLSTFQKISDELLKNTKIMLVLCGSSLSIMENDVLGYRSPLYGRDINSWKLAPFSFKVVLQLNEDIEEAMKEYFVFGGIPYYLKFYNKKEDLTTNIKNNFLIKGFNLYDEPLILLRQEFRESRTYRLILKYISLGYKSIGEICNATGMDKSNLMKYLSTLEETNIIRHILPFGMKRKGIYEINDPLFRFWFKFVYPNKDKLEIGNTAEVENYVKKEINSFFGLSFEYLIEELINEKLFSEIINYSNTRKWWYKDKEIDLIVFNELKTEILFVECKWSNNINAESIVSDLSEKSKSVRWNNETRTDAFALFAKTFSKKIDSFNGKKVFCYDLRDIEKRFREEEKENFAETNRI